MAYCLKVNCINADYRMNRGWWMQRSTAGWDERESDSASQPRGRGGQLTACVTSASRRGFWSELRHRAHRQSPMPAQWSTQPPCTPSHALHPDAPPLPPTSTSTRPPCTPRSQ